jgi:hypothetical protein
MTTVGEALKAYYAANGIDADPQQSATWVCRIGPMLLRCPNWKWRQDAITRHDLHHVLTGYSCTIAGEMQMAAWEFAAGRYRHWGATLFCLPLAIAGFICAPRRTFRAFRRGLTSTSLYGSDLELNKPLALLQLEVSKRGTENDCRVR